MWHHHRSTCAVRCSWLYEYVQYLVSTALPVQWSMLIVAHHRVCLCFRLSISIQWIVSAVVAAGFVLVHQETGTRQEPRINHAVQSEIPSITVDRGIVAASRDFADASMLALLGCTDQPRQGYSNGKGR